MHRKPGIHPPLPLVMAAILTVVGPLLATEAPPAQAPPPDASPPDAPDGAIVHVLIETVIIDRGGTQSAGADEADLAPGAAGVLEKEITLTGRDRAKTREKVVVEARLTPVAVPPEGTICELRVQTTTRRQAGAAGASGAAGVPAAGDAVLDRRESVVALAPGEERLVEAYSSSMTGGRIALKLRCDPARAAAGGVPELVTIDLGVEKRADDEPTELLRSQRLVAALGREVSTDIVANQALQDDPGGGKRYRRERLEAVLSPVMMAGGRLQIEVVIRGDVTTVSSDRGPSIMPFERIESFLVLPGERRGFDIVVTAGGPDDGWSRVTFLVEVTARF